MSPSSARVVGNTVFFIMAATTIGELDLSWLKNGRGLMYNVRDIVWEHISTCVYEHIMAEIEDEDKQKQANDSAAILANAKAAADDGTTAKNAHRMLREQEFPITLYTQFKKNYPRSSTSKGYQEQKRGKFTKDTIKNISEAMLFMDGIIKEIQDLTRGTFFDDIPFAVYISFICVYTRFPDAAKIEWWQEMDNFKLMSKIALKAWPKSFSNEEKEKIESGSVLLQYTIVAVIAAFEDDNNIYQLSEAIKENIENIAGAVGEVSHTTAAHITYLEQSEEDEMIKHLKNINESISTFLEMQGKAIRGMYKLQKTPPKRLTDQYMMAQNTIYTDEKEVMSSFYTTFLTTQGTAVFLGLVRVAEQMKLKPDFQKAVRTACSIKETDAPFLPDNSAAVTELLRISLFFHAHGTGFARIYDAKPMIGQYMNRMNADAEFKIVQKRAENKRQKVAHTGFVDDGIDESEEESGTE